VSEVVSETRMTHGLAYRGPLIFSKREIDSRSEGDATVQLGLPRPFNSLCPPPSKHVLAVDRSTRSAATVQLRMTNVYSSPSVERWLASPS
jgi:hypothetical protein